MINFCKEIVAKESDPTFIAAGPAEFDAQVVGPEATGISPPKI